MATIYLHVDARVSATNSARFGWVISNGQEVLAHGSEDPPGSFWQSNDAEAFAVVAGAQALAEELLHRPVPDLSAVVIVSDSRSVIDHITGRALISGSAMTAPMNLLRAICRRLPACHFVWVPREMNRPADWLTRDPDPRRPMPEVPPLPLEPAAPPREPRSGKRAKPPRSSKPLKPKIRAPLSPARCGWRSLRASGMTTLGDLAQRKLAELARRLEYEEERRELERLWGAP